MTKGPCYGLCSLRFKLVLASVLVEVVMLSVLVWNSTRITSDALQEVYRDRVDTLVPMLNVSLAGPLAQRDFATLDEWLDRMVNRESLMYVEVRDELGKVVGRRGAVPEIEQLDVSFDVSDQVYDQAFNITLGSRAIGRARYGLNVGLVKKTVTGLRNQGMLLASIEIVLSVLLLATLGYWLTRHLQTLAQAARAVASGDYTVRVRASGRDEVADTALAFNAMAATVERDISERKRAEATIQRLAYWDALTELPNRVSLFARLKELVADPASETKNLALLLININNFRDTNDTLGHANGDDLLIQIAKRLRQALWECDMVARLAGDEFGALLPRLAQAEHIDLVVRKITDAMQPPIVIADIPLDVRVAIGVALHPTHGRSAEMLFQHADVALHEAKRNNTTWVIYDAAFDNFQPQQLSLMSELRTAIVQNTLALHYQPKINLKSSQVAGVEALVRWNHPKRGMLPPMDFITIAEKTGLIDDLTRWVITTALQQAKHWCDMGLWIKIAVNISARNLQHRDFVQQMVEIMSTSESAAEQLIFEITESAIMLDPLGAKRKLNELHQLGVRFSIDDFGTGYSSLTYLKELPVSQLKIDKSFIVDFRDKRNASIVRSTIELAHNLGIEVIAEGVEDQTTLDALKVLGCDEAQGYHIGRPMPVSDIATWLPRWLAKSSASG